MTDAQFTAQAMEAMRSIGATDPEIVWEVEDRSAIGSLALALKVPVIGVRFKDRGQHYEMTTVRKSPGLDSAAMSRTLDAVRRLAD